MRRPPLTALPLRTGATVATVLAATTVVGLAVDAGQPTSTSPQVSLAATAPVATSTSAVKIPSSALLGPADLPKMADPWRTTLTRYTDGDFLKVPCTDTQMTQIGAKRVKERWFNWHPGAMPRNNAEHVVAVFPDAATARKAHARIVRRIDSCDRRALDPQHTRRTATFRDATAQGATWLTHYPTYGQDGTWSHLGVVRSGRAVSILHVENTGTRTMRERGLLPATRKTGVRLAQTVAAPAS